jgi:hypothetical protein
MNREQYEYVVKTYENIVLNQVLDTQALRTAANYIMNRPVDTLISINKARQIIYSFYNYQRAEFLKAFEDFLNDSDTTDTASTAGSAADTSDEQSHREDVNYVGIREEEPEEEQRQIVMHEDNSVSVDDKHYTELEILEKQYAEASDANEKRSIKMKLNALKKKLDATL